MPYPSLMKLRDTLEYAKVEGPEGPLYVLDRCGPVAVSAAALLADEDVAFALWFVEHVDFGPAHEDVMEEYRRLFDSRTKV